jgi:integrase/recombinase XerD
MQTRLPPSSIISSQTARTRPPPATVGVLLSAASSSIPAQRPGPLAAVHSGARHPVEEGPAESGNYLEADDMRAIIAKPDRRTDDGWRDYTLLLFLYNCGARVTEAIGVRWTDLQLVPPRQVRLRGKGRKERLLPLWRETADALHRLRGMPTGTEQQHVFANQHSQPLSRDGVAYIPRKYVSEVTAEGPPTLARKHITPHHTCFATM